MGACRPQRRRRRHSRQSRSGVLKIRARQQRPCIMCEAASMACTCHVVSGELRTSMTHPKFRSARYCVGRAASVGMHCRRRCAFRSGPALAPVGSLCGTPWAQLGTSISRDGVRLAPIHVDYRNRCVRVKIHKTGCLHCGRPMPVHQRLWHDLRMARWRCLRLHAFVSGLLPWVGCHSYMHASARAAIELSEGLGKASGGCVLETAIVGQSRFAFALR